MKKEKRLVAVINVQVSHFVGEQELVVPAV